MSNSDTENALVAFGGTIMATAEGGQWHEAMEMLGNMEKDIAVRSILPSALSLSAASVLVIAFGNSAVQVDLVLSSLSHIS